MLQDRRNGNKSPQNISSGDLLSSGAEQKTGGNENGLGQTQFLKASRSPDVFSSRERQRERESGPPEATEEKKGPCVPRSRDV